MSFVYGPVPSRRLGKSLGIDPIPFKTCNYNCIYCQLGRTVPVTTERRDFFPPEAILAEVFGALKRHSPEEIDYVTFVGQGEPLLCASLGALIAAVKRLTKAPIAVITNGSLLYLPDVRHELQAADLVIPTLDAADEDTFRRINRSSPGLKIDSIVDGLAAFRREFAGKLWIEVMLVRDVNDGETALRSLASAIDAIQPDRIHLNVPIRPPAENWVRAPEPEGLLRATTVLGSIAEVVPPAHGAFRLQQELPIAEAIVNILRRHPMSNRELLETLRRVAPEEADSVLERLEHAANVRRREFNGRFFWTFQPSAGSASAVSRPRRES